MRANLGDIDGALASYRKAQRLLEGVATASRDNGDDVQPVADAEFGIGTLLRERAAKITVYAVQ